MGWGLTAPRFNVNKILPMTLYIFDALSSLDIDNDEHWTVEGLPRLDVVKELTGNPVTRQDITNVAVNFTRQNPVIVSESVGPPDTNQDDAAANELVAARKDLDAAERRFKQAQSGMDVIIQRESDKNPNQTNAATIKSFQQSQQDQRVREANHKAAMEKMLYSMN